MLPLSSMVKYEMQRLASTSYGATIAFVGHTSMQLVQVPQWLVTDISSMLSGKLV